MNIICPWCGGDIHVMDRSEPEYYEGDTLFVRVVGKCESCGKKVQWEELFEFASTTDLKII